jgi:carboxymethylenebutenolidase
LRWKKMGTRSQATYVNFSHHGCNASGPNQILTSDPHSFVKKEGRHDNSKCSHSSLVRGSFSACLAAPSSQSRAGIVLIQEVLGLNNNLRQAADDYAKAGYLAIVPDSYWRLEPGV